MNRLNGLGVEVIRRYKHSVLVEVEVHGGRVERLDSRGEHLDFFHFSHAKIRLLVSKSMVEVRS